jgi:hypothetical protein
MAINVLQDCLHLQSCLKIEAVIFSETFVTIYHKVWRRNPEVRSRNDIAYVIIV